MGGLASSLDASLTLAPGRILGRYRVLRRLAVGGMAELHLAQIVDSTEPDPFVVIKRVLPHLALDPEFVTLFRHEAQVSALLHHDNIVEVTEVAQIEDELCYVMRYVHGANLRRVLTESARCDGLPMDVALTIVAAAARGLHHAHEQRDIEGKPLGLVHRDVSPSNILIGYDGSVRVTDFGISKAAARTDRTRGSVMKGKVGYMSPEQCQGLRVDRRSDVHALGILLYETTTQSRLFWADGDFAVLSQIVQGQFEPPSARVDGYADELEAIVLQALSVEPDDRFPTAAAFGKAVEEFARRNGFKLSLTRVGDHMKAVFGSPIPPSVEFADTDFDALGDGTTRVRTGVAPSRSTARRLLVPAALLIAVGGGFGLGAVLRADSTPAPVEAPPEPAAIVQAPPAEPEPSEPEEQPESEPDLEPADEPEIVVEPEPAPDPAPKIRRKSKPKSKPKPKSSPKSKPSSKSLFPDTF